MLARFILSTTFTPGEDFLAGQIANALEHTTLGELTSDALVDTVLDRIDILVASDFGLVQLSCV